MIVRVSTSLETSKNCKTRISYYCVVLEEDRTPLVVHEEEEWEDCDDEAADDEDHHHQAAVNVPLLPAHPPPLKLLNNILNKLWQIDNHKNTGW